MVYHVGILLFQNTNAAYAYNTDTKSTTSLDIRNLQFDDDGFIDKLFKNLKAGIPQAELGCACICWHYDFGEETKKELIRAGTNYGFSKVAIIDKSIAIGWEAIAQSGYKPKNGDNIWIIYETIMYFWKQVDDVLSLTCVYDSKNLTESEMKGFMKDYGKPQLAAYYHKDMIFRIVLRKTFPESFVFMYTLSGKYDYYLKWALKEAMIMGGCTDKLNLPK